MGTEYGIGTGTEQVFGMADVGKEKAKTADQGDWRFAGNKVTDFIRDECDRLIEQLLPTMAINGDAMEDCLRAHAFTLAHELVERRNSNIERLESALKCQRRMLAAFSILLAAGAGFSVMTTGVGALAVAVIGLFVLIPLREVLMPSHKDELESVFKETLEEAYARFRANRGQTPANPEVVLLGRNGLLYKTSAGLPRYVEYKRVSAVMQQSHEIVSVVVDDEVALNLDATVPGYRVLEKVLDKITKAKNSLVGEVAA
jgi:hypothetical protein